MFIRRFLPAIQEGEILWKHNQRIYSYSGFIMTSDAILSYLIKVCFHFSQKGNTHTDKAFCINIYCCYIFYSAACVLSGLTIRERATGQLEQDGSMRKPCVRKRWLCIFSGSTSVTKVSIRKWNPITIKQCSLRMR